MEVTVRSLIAHLLPKGTRGIKSATSDSYCIEEFPFWPPDLFGVCAYLLQQSDSYTYIHSHGKNTLGSELKASAALDNIVAEDWADSGLLDHIEEHINTEWKKIVSCTTSITEASATCDWVKSATRLAIIADTACAGIGFDRWTANKKSESCDSCDAWIPAIYDALNKGKIANNAVNEAIHSKTADKIITHASKNLEEADGDKEAKVTACLMIPSAVLCVLPKARIPSSGCTLRSLTHHLSLHPSSGQLKSTWILPPLHSTQDTDSFNILYVPYPFQMDNDVFNFKKNTKNKYGTFTLNQSWLKKGKPISKIVKELIDNALSHGIKIDAVLLPEASISEDTYASIIAVIEEKSTPSAPILLICGAVDKSSGCEENVSICSLISSKGTNISFKQRKHHRWSLDDNQLANYGITAPEPKARWWENIQISNRVLNYFVFRHGSCLATLVCEDLARTDPCQASIRSVGPNLLIAMLMDGPQMKGRWPERYAMGLADDPGTSVLTVTSTGLIHRSNSALNKSSNSVALWRDCISNETKELGLGPGKRGLLLELKNCQREEESLDGRGDDGAADVWTLKNTIQLD